MVIQEFLEDDKFPEQTSLPFQADDIRCDSSGRAVANVQIDCTAWRQPARHLG